jgi:hypothetical protein
MRRTQMEKPFDSSSSMLKIDKKEGDLQIAANV